MFGYALFLGGERKLSNKRRVIELRGYPKGVCGIYFCRKTAIGEITLKLLGDFRRKNLNYSLNAAF
jgi:hypothetical protein